MAHVDRKHSLLIWGYLLLLTVLEVGIVYIPGVDPTLLILGLVGMACVKAALVCFYYMHLKWETDTLKWTIVIPMLTPAVYAVALVLEASYRLVA